MKTIFDVDVGDFIWIVSFLVNDELHTEYYTTTEDAKTAFNARDEIGDETVIAQDTNV